MKIDRLIGIITILLGQDKVTAPELAKRFEVSRRTINRDIEDICKAGIPLITTQGYDDECAGEIRQGLEQKLDALVRHELYAKYKTAPTAEEREQARKEYLDKRGVFPDFRW